MTVANPLFLGVLSAAALPVIFHLLMKRQRKVHHFPSFLFFIRADPRMQSRRRLREILLLALRMLAIIFLSLALARPALQMGFGFGGTKAVVIVLDNSGSMNAPTDAQRTKLSAAINAAQLLIGRLSKDADVGVVLTVDDAAAAISAGMTVEKQELAESLARIQPTEAAGQPGLALNTAADYLREIATRRNSGLAIHIFSDLQENEWKQAAIHLDAPNTSVVVHRIPSHRPTAANVAIVGIKLPPTKILPNHPCRVSVLLRNDEQATAAVRLNREDSTQQTETRAITLAPGASQTAEFMLTPTEPGRYWMRFWVEGDALTLDNAAAIGFECTPRANVVLAGTPADFALLGQVISPRGDGRFTSLVPNFVAAQQLQAGIDEHEPAMVVSTWTALEDPAHAQTLRLYASAGGNVFLLPSADSREAGKGPDWLDADTLPLVRHEEEVPIDLLDRRSPIWGALRTDAGKTAVRYVTAAQYMPMRLGPDYRILLGPSYAEPVLAHRRFDKGRIFVSGLAMDRRWSTLVTDPSGLSLVLTQNIALGGDESQQQFIALVAGEQPPVLEASSAELQLSTVIGDPLQETVSANRLPAFPRSGVYALESPDRSWTISVRAADSEGKPEMISGESIPLLASIDHKVFDYEDMDSFEHQLAAGSRGTALFLPLILLAIAALMTESWLGSAASRKRTEAGAFP
ncbi:MAG: hypothetical protein ACI8W8_002309 [Rhodothermales bacterium]|jgi:hypothetical protein